MRELRTLRLPQLVEARRKRESAGVLVESPDPAAMGHFLTPSHSSSSSDAPSPVTPTFSMRSHSRFPSSSSSFASSPTMRESVDGFNALKRLTEVNEELHERDEDEDRLGQFENQRGCHYTDRGMRDIVGDRVANRKSPFPLVYDLADDTAYYKNADMEASAKRRCAEDYPFVGFTSRFGTRFPSFSRRWNNRRAGNTGSVADSLQETIISRSRANSLRAPSLKDSIGDSVERGDAHPPTTPARSVFEERYDEAPVSPIDIQKANAPLEGDEIDAEDLATTPLLPPLMVQFSSKFANTPVQSPLQSPTVADSPSAVHTPIEGPQHSGLPSPPLSNKPSISSFHHRQLAPNSDIPQIQLADPHDEWANKLGHANFTIQPEPYLPTTFDLSACKQLRSDWDAARLNFMKHLARTGEHYSTTSKFHQLTEDKWAEVDAQWKRNYELMKASCKLDDSEETTALSKHTSVTEPIPLIKIPSLNGPKSEGKFPKLGDEGIVGPMVREKSQAQPRRPTRKRAFWKFLQGVLPSSVAFGRGQA